MTLGSPRHPSIIRGSPVFLATVVSGDSPLRERQSPRLKERVSRGAGVGSLSLLWVFFHFGLCSPLITFHRNHGSEIVKVEFLVQRLKKIGHFLTVTKDGILQFWSESFTLTSSFRVSGAHRGGRRASAFTPSRLLFWACGLGIRACSWGQVWLSCGAMSLTLLF